MAKIIVISFIIFFVFLWLRRRHQLRNIELSAPQINNGVKNNFGARKNYM